MDVTPDVIPKWADYQSLLQISIGFNAAYFSISQFVSLDATAQEKLVELARDLADKLLPEATLEDIRNELSSLHSEILQQKSTDKKWLAGIGKVSIFFFLLGFVVLFYASISAGQPVNPRWIVGFCISSVLPFILGVLYMALHSSAKYQNLAQRRQAIEDRLTKAIQVFRQKMEAEKANAPVATKTD